MPNKRNIYKPLISYLDEDHAAEIRGRVGIILWACNQVFEGATCEEQLHNETKFVFTHKNASCAVSILKFNGPNDDIIMDIIFDLSSIKAAAAMSAAELRASGFAH